MGGAELALAVRELCSWDERLAGLVARDGQPPLWRRPQGFATLVWIILEQQVSLAAARTLYRRIEVAVGGKPTPASVIQLGATGMRALGVTGLKAGFCCDLAARIDRGDLDLAALPRLPDADVLRALTAVRGIGPWTAGIYLLMALGRPDVWPDGDLALNVALGRLLGRPAVMGSGAAALHAGRWRPWRSVAARILWNSYLADRRRGRSGG